jgi:hypothetical protein
MKNLVPGELLLRRNEDGSSSPVFVFGLLSRRDTLLSYLMWDGCHPPYEFFWLMDITQLGDTVYKRL